MRRTRALPETAPGLAIHRQTEPWQGNGMTTRTLWTADHRGTVIGEWDGDSFNIGWVLGGDDQRYPAPTRLREWRSAVVAEALQREAAR